MEREGAAFAGAAAQLPSTQLGYGMQALSQAQGKYADATAERGAQYTQLRGQVIGSRGELVSNELQRIRDNNLNKQKLAEDQREFNVNARQARVNANIQWQSVKGTLAAYGLDEKKLLQAEAEFMTDQTGVINKVVYDKKGNGRVVATTQLAPGSDAASTGGDEDERCDDDGEGQGEASRRRLWLTAGPRSRRRQARCAPPAPTGPGSRSRTRSRRRC
jgi:hypothetical protein